MKSILEDKEYSSIFLYYLIIKAIPKKYVETTKDSLWLLVTNDEFELPLCAADNLKDLVKNCGVCKGVLSNLAMKGIPSRVPYVDEKYKVIKVKGMRSIRG